MKNYLIIICCGLQHYLVPRHLSYRMRYAPCLRRVPGIVIANLSCKLPAPGLFFLVWAELRCTLSLVLPAKKPDPKIK